MTPPIHAVADQEGVDPVHLSRQITEGRVVILQRGDRAIGIGEGLRTKVNVNLGTSSVRISLEEEIQKARIAETYGADTISDLSMGGNITEIRQEILRHTTLPITTVPIYQTAVEVGLRTMRSEDLLATIRNQVNQGVSSLVIHCVNRPMLELLKEKKRLLGVVSKGGSITSAYMLLHQCENPFLEQFGELLCILKRHDIVLSLGNTARSGCILDEWDAVQEEELQLNVQLAHQAHQAGVQVIIEGGGGHIHYNRIAESMRRYKRASPFPLFVAGPLPIDVGLGYDHIAGCAGASAASAAGADYLCAITPSEHLGLPSIDHVREGLIAFRIAAHIGDLVKFGKDRADREMAIHRANVYREGQFRLAFDEARAREIAGKEEDCTMCGEYCAIKLMRDLL
ncbi:MAG: phosphomethylpyrimidine synthase ThiC [Methanomicrobiales archaeon]|nr:phosphomethylpyrimidine synthase ThiC [Methanomicrobiales archaeon]